MNQPSLRRSLSALALIALLAMTSAHVLADGIEPSATQDQARQSATASASMPSAPEITDLFERMRYREHMTRTLVRLNREAIESRLDPELDGDALDARRRQLERIGQRIEQALSWDKLQPIGIAAYRRRPPGFE